MARSTTYQLVRRVLDEQKNRMAKPTKPGSKLEEGRGRPRKNPNDPKWQKKSVNGEEGEDDFGPDRGPEPDKNIQVQLKKAVDSKDEKGGADVEFANGKKKFVPHHVASAVLGALNKMKPEHRGKAQDMLQQSHENLMAVHQSLKK